MKRKRLAALAATLVAGLALVVAPESAQAVNGSCSVTQHVIYPYYVGSYTLGGYAISVSCTQKNLITVTVASVPAGRTTKTSTIEDYAICQSTSCTASTSWAITAGSPCAVDWGVVTIAADKSYTKHPGTTGLVC